MLPLALLSALATLLWPEHTAQKKPLGQAAVVGRLSCDSLLCMMQVTILFYSFPGKVLLQAPCLMGKNDSPSMIESCLMLHFTFS